MENSLSFYQKQAIAQEMGWKVVEKELYNPGGTEYRLILVDPNGTEMGYVDKSVEWTSNGVTRYKMTPDENSPTWDALFKGL